MATAKQSPRRPSVKRKTSARGKARQRKRPVPPPRSRLSRALGLFVSLGVRLTLIGIVIALVGGIWVDFKVRAQFEGRKWAVPGRVYARPLELFEGQPITAAELRTELELSSYREDNELRRPGSFSQSGDSFRVRTRGFRFWDGKEPPRSLRVKLESGRVARLAQDSGKVPITRLEPAVIGRFDARHNEDRVLVTLDDVTPLLPAALIAVEDRNFYKHHGLSVRALVRAVYANLRAGRSVQGGSTLTQQLVKNYFLNPERTLKRKLVEATYAIVLELRYSKREILEAYLNEVFLGQAGSRSINGFGLGARHYFGRPASELLLHEAALLTAMVRGPSYYDPRRHPERAMQRRNRVIGLLADSGVITRDLAEQAKQRPLGVTKRPRNETLPYYAFMELVRRQIDRDYREEDLRSEGLHIFTTLDPQLQSATQNAIKQQLVALEAGEGAVARGRENLQGAAIVAVPQTGEVLALVAGRDGDDIGFNRALDAERGIGSLIKPFVLLDALRADVTPRLTLASLVEDAPVTIETRGSPPWTPQNYDRKFHGPVTLYETLTRSYNTATVRMGQHAGVASLSESLERLGLDAAPRALPSLFLGAVGLSPYQVTSLYQPLANQGLRVPLRAIREVTRADGTALTRYGIDVEQVATAEEVYLVETAMRGVMREGTGRSAYNEGGLAANMTVAGKTGTTNDLRDSWFAGFSGDRLAVAWVGRDDNKSAGLTGSSGALQVWKRVMRDSARRGRRAQGPASLVWASVDSRVGMLTDDGCSGARRLPFIAGTEPAYVPCGGQARVVVRDATRSSGSGGRGLLDRLFWGDEEATDKPFFRPKDDR